MDANDFNNDRYTAADELEEKIKELEGEMSRECYNALMELADQLREDEE